MDNRHLEIMQSKPDLFCSMKKSVEKWINSGIDIYCRHWMFKSSNRW